MNNTSCLTSSIIESAENLAGQSVEISYRWYDVYNFINERWNYIYKSLSIIDPWFYGMPVKITKEYFIPLEFTNAVKVYEAASPFDSNRIEFEQASNLDIESYGVYNLEGRRLFCPAASSGSVYALLIPNPPDLSWPRNNKTYKEMSPTPAPVPDQPPSSYLFYDITYGPSQSHPEWSQYGNIIFTDRRTGVEIDKTMVFNKHDHKIVHLSLSGDMMFVTVENLYTGLYSSEIYDISDECSRSVIFNCFDYTGRGTHVKFINTYWNIYNGGNITLYDQDDGKYKTDIGCFPDTVVNYPSSVGIYLLIAELAQKLALKNSNKRQSVMEALASSKTEFDKFIKVNKASWDKIRISRPFSSYGY